MRAAKEGRGWLVGALVALVCLFVSSPAQASLPAADELAAPLAADPFTQLINAAARADALAAEHARELARFALFARVPCGSGFLVGDCAQVQALEGLKTRVWGFDLSLEEQLLENQEFRWETAEVPVEFGFHGRPLDTETGLLYFRNRYFDPELGRFVTTDPMGYADGPNLYAFALNDPVNGSDPLGLDGIIVNENGEKEQETGPHLYQTLLKEGMSPEEATKWVVAAGFGDEISYDVTRQMIPAMVAAEKVINTATAATLGAYGLGFGAASLAPYLPEITFALRHPVTAGTGACLSNPGACQELAADLAYGAMGGQGPTTPATMPRPRLDLPVPSTGPLKAASGNLDEAAHAARTQPYYPMAPPPPPRAVIGKVKDLKRVGENETTLLNSLPDQGNPQANWAQNSGVLRREMNKNLPIRDASVDPVTGELIAYPGSFLNAERNLLRDRGWTYDPATRLWSPP